MNTLILSLHFYEIFPKLANFQRSYSQNTGHLYNESKLGNNACLPSLHITQPVLALRIPKTVFILGRCSMHYPASVRPPDSQIRLYTRPMFYPLPSQCSPSGFPKPSLYSAHVLYITQPVFALRIPKTVFILGNCSMHYAASARPPDSQNRLFTGPMFYTLPSYFSPSGFPKPSLYSTHVLYITQQVFALRYSLIRLYTRPIF